MWKEPRDQRLVVMFRDHYVGQEPTDPYDYCLIHLTVGQKQKLLAGNTDGELEVYAELLNMHLLRIGNGLTYDLVFLEEKDVVGQHEAYDMTL